MQGHREEEQSHGWRDEQGPQRPSAELPAWFVHPIDLW